MEYVVVRRTSDGYWLDAADYKAALPEITDGLPAGARAFATDPDHYDFYSDRCVKDLWFASLRVDDESGAVTLTLNPNNSKHPVGLTVTYEAAAGIALERDGNPQIGWLGSVLLDELLPAQGGVAHEIVLTGGTLRIVAADLHAVWGDGIVLPWQPLLQVSSTTWVGLVTSEWWAGSQARPCRPIDLNEPTALLPLLELSLDEATTRLDAVVAALPPKAPFPSPGVIIETAVAVQSPYWVDRAIRWVEDQPTTIGPAILKAIADSRWASQGARQKASRLMRSHSPVTAPFVVAVSELAARAGVDPELAVTDEHVRWDLYRKSLDDAGLRAQVLHTVGLDGETALASAVVVAALEFVPQRERSGWVDALPVDVRGFASRRMHELAIFEAQIGVGAQAPTESAITEWSQWLQLRLATTTVNHELLDLLARAGSTKRIRNLASQRLTTGRK